MRKKIRGISVLASAALMMLSSPVMAKEIKCSDLLAQLEEINPDFGRADYNYHLKVGDTLINDTSYNGYIFFDSLEYVAGEDPAPYGETILISGSSITWDDSYPVTSGGAGEVATMAYWDIYEAAISTEDESFCLCICPSVYQSQVHEHIWDSAWSVTADGHHYHACTVDDCAYDITLGLEDGCAYAEHSGGTATCQAKAVCSACGTAYGELADHVYGSWKKADDVDHARVCACGEIQTELHKWDAGSITTPATEQNEGVKTYTCSVCGGTKTEPIDKLTPAPQPKPTPAPAEPETPAKAENIKGVIVASAKAGNKKVTLKWNEVKGATSYTVYYSVCNGKSYKKKATVTGTQYVVKNLNNKKQYKFCIKANGADNTLSSTTCHVAMPKNKRTNPKSIKLNLKSVSLTAGKTRTIKATVKKEKSSKKLLGHVAKVR